MRPLQSFAQDQEAASFIFEVLSSADVARRCKDAEERKKATTKATAEKKANAKKYPCFGASKKSTSTEPKHKDLAELLKDERLVVRALAWTRRKDTDAQQAWTRRKDTDAQQACTHGDAHADAAGRTTIVCREPESDKSNEVELRVARSLAKTYKTVDELQHAKNNKFSDLDRDSKPSGEEDKHDKLGRLSFGLFDLTDQTSFLQTLGSIFLQCGPVVCLTLMQIWPSQLKETLGQISNVCDSKIKKSCN